MDRFLSHRPKNIKETQRPQKLVLVSHTHWDREWYLSFQEFRIRLVRLIDLLLNVFSRVPSFQHFTLDGQTIVLEDYLEIRPEREGDLHRLIGEGRILVGPWYVIPDEFLVSGEALIRNLLRGHRLAQGFGGVMEVGYLPDPFGHIAQMPQILRGFGITTALLWRGIGREIKQSEFLWQSPDGSEVLAIYMPGAYDNAAALPSSTPEFLQAIKDLRQQLTPYASTGNLLLMNGDDHLEPQPHIGETIAEANKKLKDAVIIHGTIPQYAQLVREAAEQDNIIWQTVQGELRSSELAHLLAGVLSSRLPLKQLDARTERLLRTWAEPFATLAELVAPTPQGATQGLAWRPLIDTAWRYLLQNHPHDSICGCSIDAVHDDMTTRYRWANEIGEIIAEQALETLSLNINSNAVSLPTGYQIIDSTNHDEAQVNTPGCIVVVNPDGGPRTDFVEVAVQLPPTSHDLALADEQGTLLPYQVLRERQSMVFSATLPSEQVRLYLRMAGIGGNWPNWKIRILERIASRVLKDKIPDLAVVSAEIHVDPGQPTADILVGMGSGKHDYETIGRTLRQLSAMLSREEVHSYRIRVVKRDEVDIGFVAPMVPGHGYRLFQLLAGHRQRQRMSTPSISTNIENEFFTVQADQENGSLTIVDKETGTILQGINSFLDSGDAGDEYTYSPPAQDLSIITPTRPPTTMLVDNGPSRFTLRIQQTLAIPESLTGDRQARSMATVECPITSFVSLSAGVRRIDIRTEVENRAKDHRLRVLFPSGIQTSQSHAEGQFAVTDRPVELPVSFDRWAEQPVTSYPQRGFVDINDRQNGLMVANIGLPEHEIIPSKEGVTIALTLTRAVGWLSRDDLSTREGAAGPIIATPAAQVLGSAQFEYSVIPHAGGWEQGFRQAHWFINPLRALRTYAHNGPLPPAASMIDIKPDTIVISTIKPPENGTGIIIRAFNITSTPVRARISTAFKVNSATLVNLKEEIIEDLAIAFDGTIELSIGANQIVTVRMHLELM